MGEATSELELGSAYSIQGDIIKSAAHLRRALELHRQAGNRDQQLRAVSALGTIAEELGQFESALSHFEEAVLLLDDRYDYAAGGLYNNVGYMQIKMGRVPEALTTLEHAVTVCRAVDDRHLEIFAASNIGDAYRRLGRYDEALTHLDRALALAVEVGIQPSTAYARNRLGNAYRDLGRIDDARAELEEALRISRTAISPISEPEALIDLAATVFAAGELVTANDLARAGLDIAAEQGRRYQEARACDLLDHICRRSGRPDAAAQYRRRADDLLTELGHPGTDVLGATLADGSAPRGGSEPG